MYWDPAKTMEKSAKPTAKGPTTPKLGCPMATAYTTLTSTKVITSSQPNSMAASTHPSQALYFTSVTLFVALAYSTLTRMEVITSAQPNTGCRHRPSHFGS